MPEFICPVCGEKLIKNNKTYNCPSGHNYDIAKSGYVNLLPGSTRGGRHGDDKLMVRARCEFLSKGWYDPLSEAIAECVDYLTSDNSQIVDAGCGEAKYTVDIQNKLLKSNKTFDIAGLDISKDALIYAAKRSRMLQLCVASSSRMPFADNSTDIILNIFSPFVPSEFLRILRTGGYLIRAIPLERHLWELKALIYDTPRENIIGNMETEGFKIINNKEIKYKFSLTSNEDIMNLFKMTPYYYKTGTTDQYKAISANNLDVSAEFGIIIYQKL